MLEVSRYEQLTDIIIGMIDNSAIPPGARLLLVRTASEQRHISISVALQAYRILEERGILFAWALSGYYDANLRDQAGGLPS